MRWRPSVIANALKSIRTLMRAAMIKPAHLGLIVRCKDESFVAEFCDHYLSEGVDRIIIVDDGSADRSIYSNLSDPRVTILFEKDIIRRNYVPILYRRIRKKFSWLIFVDADEFISGRGTESPTIREALDTVFVNAHCVKVPWVMMSCAKRPASPESLRRDLVYRWNHDLRHPHPIKKFRCRYEKIEVKCIFRPGIFRGISDHHPLSPEHSNPVIVESIMGSPAPLDPFYCGLREADICRGVLACYHYRVTSVACVAKKLERNIFYQDYSVDDVMASDYSEVFDDTLKHKADRGRSLG